MRLGKIDYLNLLPFDVFIKKFPISNQIKSIIAYKQAYPAKLNRDFLFRRLDGGFLSSIMSYGRRDIRKKCGIVSHGEVMSVLVLPKEDKSDYQSASSNALVKVLKIQGEVLIGDKALIYHLNGGEGIDLGKMWWDKKRLPFVFGLFCVTQHKDRADKISSSFVRRKIKIPQYILQKASQKSGLASKDILKYLTKIGYVIGVKEKRGLEVFYRELMFCRIKKPKRFD